LETIDDISEQLEKMDSIYGAVFSTWVSDEKNLPTSLVQFCEVANEYPLPQMILAVKWITRKWKLSSIIMLVNSLTRSWQCEHEIALFAKSVCHPWKTRYVAGFIAAMMERWQSKLPKKSTSIATEALRKKQEAFLCTLMEGWTFSRISQVFLRLGPSVDWEVKCAIFRRFRHHQTNHTAHTSSLDDSASTPTLAPFLTVCTSQTTPSEIPLTAETIDEIMKEPCSPLTPSQQRKPVSSNRNATSAMEIDP
jgi:hypothetical protein